MAPDPEAKISCPTPQHLQAELENLNAILALGEKEETWDKMEKALIRFAGVTRGGGYKHLPLFTDGIGRKGCASKVAECMLSDRGRLSTAAVEFLQAFAPRLHQQFAPVVQPYFEPLLKLFARPNKVFLKRSERCLIKILENCHLPQIIMELRKGLNDDAVTCRRICSTGIERAMSEWDIEVFTERSLVSLEEGLRRMATDKDAEVRQTGKRVWGKFMELWPERVDDFSAPLTPTIRRYLNLPAQGAAVKGKGKAKAVPPRPAPAPIASASTAPPLAAAKPIPLRVAALATKPPRAALRPTPIEHLEPRQAHASSSRQVSPKKVSPKKVARIEPAHSAPPYKSMALAPLPSRPDVAPLNGRSVSHTILPTVHSSTSIAENVQRSTRPILPQSYSTTALPTEPSNFVSRFATGPIRIIRPAPIIQDDGGDPDGFMYGQPVFGGPSRPTQHLGHGRKPIGPARRVVTAPTPSKEGLGYPTRTPAANRILSRNIRDKVEEMEEQPVPISSNVLDPSTPAPIRKVVEETPPRLPRVESPLLPVLPPDVEDVRDTSMLEPINGRELESPVPVEIAAMVPLPDEVDAGLEDATHIIDIQDEPEQVIDEGLVLQPAVIEATHDVGLAMSEPTSTVNELIDESAPTLEEKPLPTTSHDQSQSVTEAMIDGEPVESVAAVGEVTSPVPSLVLDQGPKHVSMLDESISTYVHVPTTSDDDTHVSRSTMDEVDPVALSTDESNVKASVKDENPAPVVLDEQEQSMTTPLIEEDTAEPVAPGVTNITDQDPNVENVELDVTPAIVIDIPAPFEEHNSLPRLSDSPTRVANVVSEIVSKSLVQVAASKVVDAEDVEDTQAAPAPATMEIADDIPASSTAAQIVEDLPVAPASEQIANIPSAPVSTQTVEDYPAASTSTQTAERVAAPILDVQVREVAPSQVEIDAPVEAEPSLPLLAQLPTRPEQILDQVDASIRDIQSKMKAPSETKVNPVTRAPSRFAQSRPPVKTVQTVKSTSASAVAPAPVPPRKPPVPRAAAISRPIKPVERKTFRPVTAAQTAAAASLAKVRNAQAVAQAEAAKPRVPSASISKPAPTEPRSRVVSATSSSSHGVTAASTKITSITSTAPAPISKTAQSRLLAPTKASASRAAPTISHPSIKVATSLISSNPALPPVRKEKIKLKAALPSFRPVRNAVRSTSGPGTGTWIAASTSKPMPRAAAIPLPHSPVSTKTGAKPESIALPASPVVVRPETMALPPSPTSSASRNVDIIQPTLQPLPASPPPVVADVPLPDSPISQASQFRSRVTRAASPAISALHARLATPSRNSSAPTMSDEESDSENEDETSGVTFKVKTDERPPSGMKMKMKLKQGGNGDLMEFSAPARMEKVWIGSTTPMYTPGRKALVIRDANLASPLVRKVVNQE